MNPPARARPRFLTWLPLALAVRGARITALPLAVLLAAGGCSMLGIGGSDSRDVTVPHSLAPYDTVGQNGDVAVPDTTLAPPVAHHPPDIATVSPPPAQQPPASPTVAALADSAAVVPTGQAISVDLPPAEREVLWNACLGDLGVADSILASPRTDEATTDEARAATREKEEIVRGFVTQARSALDRDDLEAAANLARKARLLAEELTTR